MCVQDQDNQTTIQVLNYQKHHIQGYIYSMIDLVTFIISWFNPNSWNTEIDLHLTQCSGYVNGEKEQKLKLASCDCRSTMNVRNYIYTRLDLDYNHGDVVTVFSARLRNHFKKSITILHYRPRVYYFN